MTQRRLPALARAIRSKVLTSAFERLALPFAEVRFDLSWRSDRLLA